MPVISVAFAVGVLAAGLISQPPALLAVTMAALGALVLAAAREGKASALLAGIATGWLAAALALETRLPARLDGEEMWLQGRVAGLPELQAGTPGGGIRFDLLTDAAQVQRVRVTWYGVSDVAPGAKCRLRVRLRTAHGLVNPGGFDVEAWLYRRRVGALGTVRDHSGNLCDSAAAIAPVESLRARLRTLQRQAGLVEQAAITALTIGDGSDLDDAVWQLLRDTGTTHLIVISGQHIAIIAALAFWLSALTARASPALVARFGSRRMAAVLAMVVAVAYSALAGFSVPVQRALAMTLVVLLAVAASRNVRGSDVLAVALGVVLAVDPLAWLDAGFWLSFAACGVLLWSARSRVETHSTRVLRTLRSWWRVQWAVSVGITPLLLSLFGSAPAVQVLANLVAVPVVGFVAVPMALFGTCLLALSPAWAELPLRSADVTLFVLLRLLAALAEQGRDWTLTPPASAACLWLAALLLLLPRGIPGRGLSSILLLASFLGEASRPPLAVGDVRITVLDVGQGSAALVQTRSSNWLVDAGPVSWSGFDAGAAVVVPALHALGVERLDGVLVSHLDRDHVGGLGAITAEVPVARFIAPEPLPTVAHTRLCRDGDVYRVDGVEFAIVWPRDPLPRATNDRSCVLRVRAASGRQALLPGDLQRMGEARLLAGAAAAVQAVDLLIAPHHGSRSSSSPAFVAVTRPRVVIASVGARNTFGHPHPLIAERYGQAGAEFATTAESGAVTWLSDGTLSAYRCQQPRLWRRQPPTCVPFETH